jgi:dipeptidyl aminopeptidase/acylaminoacyl peptidase
MVGAGSNAVYAQGHLLFVREATLMAQPFDVDRQSTTGDAVPVAEHIQSVLASGRAGAFSVSETGMLAYREGTASGGYTLTWVDRGGIKGAQVGSPHFIVGDIQFSPDRKSVAMAIQDSTGVDIWIYDVARGLRTRFTFDPATDSAPVWSPDGRSIIFRSNRKGHYDLYRKAVNSVATEELVYADDVDKLPTSWSADARFLLYEAVAAGTNRGRDIWVLPLMPEPPGATPKPSLVLQTPFNEGLAKFSPDGRWILYTSDESQRLEVYVAPFSPSRGLTGKRQISIAGMIGTNGGTPRWRQDGREIYYVSPDRKLMATEVAINGDTLDVGTTRPLFDVLSALREAFDVSVDGRRFLLPAAPEEKSTLPITLVQNWVAGLSN